MALETDLILFIEIKQDNPKIGPKGLNPFLEWKRTL
jgi:hypothetical protein